jgi:hypothetical protein
LGNGLAALFFGHGGFPSEIDMRGTDADVMIYGADDNDNLGQNFAVGDLDDDGALDHVLCASYADGPGNARWNAGDCYIYYDGVSPGIHDLRNGGYSVVLYGEEWDSLLGTPLTCDINGDGMTDLILSDRSPANDGAIEQAGAIHIILGGKRITMPGDAADRADIVIRGIANFQNLYARFCVDINKDGADEIIASTGFDEYFLFYGKRAWQLPVTLASAEVRMNIPSPLTVLTTGDPTNDGPEDLILADPSGSGPLMDRPDAGRLSLVTGRLRLPYAFSLDDLPEDLVLHGPAAGALLSSSFCSLDINDDGLEDFAVGAPGTEGPLDDRPDAGSAVILFGGGMDSLLRNGEISSLNPLSPSLPNIFEGSPTALDRFRDVFLPIASSPLVVRGDVDDSNILDPGNHPLVFYELTDESASIRLERLDETDILITW